VNDADRQIPQIVKMRDRVSVVWSIIHYPLFHYIL